MCIYIYVSFCLSFLFHDTREGEREREVELERFQDVGKRIKKLLQSSISRGSRELVPMEVGSGDAHGSSNKPTAEPDRSEKMVK